jgi:hypothetical protein|tara:strand:- start:1768 stop:2328 length:561 start_codon:yes stop_codon:yes gene_type:complete
MTSIKRKNIVRIRTNADLTLDDVKQLLKNNNNLGAAVRNSDYADIYWFQSANNYMRAQKDFQVEFVYEDGQYSIYVGFNSDWQGTMTADHVFENLVAPFCEFATKQEIKSYIGGWYDDGKITTAADLKKSPVVKEVRSVCYKKRCHYKSIYRKDGTVEHYKAYWDKREQDDNVVPLPNYVRTQGEK